MNCTKYNSKNGAHRTSAKCYSLLLTQCALHVCVCVCVNSGR